MSFHPFSRSSRSAVERLEASVILLEQRLSALNERVERAEITRESDLGRISEFEQRLARPLIAPVVEVTPMGNVANRMIQLMAAQSIADKVPGCRIEGVQLPEWGITATPQIREATQSIDVGGQWIAVDRLAQMLRSGQVDRVVLNAFGQHIENFLPVDHYRTFFRSDPRISRGFGVEDLVINVRGGEILAAPHPDYVLIPIAFYAEVIEKTGLRPVFVGQLTPSPYMDALRRQFPNATYVESRGAIADFETVRRSCNILPGISTFSWLAAWLSEANRIFLPLNGLFNPMQCPDIDLLPRNDPRYRFFLFPINFATPVENYSSAHAAVTGRWREVTREEVLNGRDQRPSKPRLLDEYLARFDSEFYVQRYPDVRHIIAIGYMASAEAHYRAAGFAENREILDLDRFNYSRAYPEAAVAVSEGRYLDFLHHYVHEGHAAGAEPRSPEQS